MDKKTKEAQYQVQIENLNELGPVQLGPTASHLWRSDPRHLGFLLARYKFCAKALAGMSRVLEVGCGDGFGMRVVLQEVKFVHGVDFDPLFIEWARSQAKLEKLNCDVSILDVTRESPPGRFEAAYSLDLIEHIPAQQEHAFMRNLVKALEPTATCIIGTPNITFQAYASEWSRQGHINCKSAETLKELLIGYFHNVFIFSMNDEVVHTGFYPMAPYLFGVAVGLKEAGAK